MKRLALLIFVLSFPVLAQYSHRSNPGQAGGTGGAITTNGTCPAQLTCQSLNVEATNTTIVAISGTWTGTISFFYTNTLYSTTVAAQCYPLNTATGALTTTPVLTTTANGTWMCDSAGFRIFFAQATAAMTGSAVLQIDADPADSIQTIVGLGASGAVPVTGATLTTFKLIALATTNANSLKGSAGSVCGWFITNQSTTIKYVKLYNKATSPTVGTDVPADTWAIPANSTTGAGSSTLGGSCISFTTGIALAITGAAADNDATVVAAGDVILNLYYQ